jgi:uncharacterized membrane protein (UPF0127 family)
MRRPGIRVVLLVMLLLVAALGGTSAQVATPTPQGPQLPWTWSLQTYKELRTIQVGDYSLTVEIADTSDLQTRGLSYRDGLEPGTGMLFVYPDSQSHTFWMKGMRFCLDIVWIDAGKITGAAENACPEPGVADAALARYPSNGPAQFVLEVPAGWLAERGYGEGTPVDLSDVDVPSGLSGR